MVGGEPDPPEPDDDACAEHREVLLGRHLAVADQCTNNVGSRHEEDEQPTDAICCALEPAKRCRALVAELMVEPRKPAGAVPTTEQETHGAGSEQPDEADDAVRSGGDTGRDGEQEVANA